MTRTRRGTSSFIAAPMLAVGCVLIACVVAVTLIAIGPSLIVLAPWDIFIDLDEAWRLHLGQVPHTDFHTPVGPLRFLLIAAGMSVVGPHLNAVVVGNMIFLLIAALLAVFTAFRRLPRVSATAFVVSIILMSAAARQIGRSPEIPGYVEFYNRFGWVLICILDMQLFFPRRRELQRLKVAEGIIIGLVIAALVYMKITYGVVALVSLAVACWLNPEFRNRRTLGAAAAATALAAVAMWALTGVSLLSYLSDVLDAAQAQSLSRRLSSIKSTVRSSARFVALILAAWVALVALPTFRGRISRHRAIRSSATVAFIAASGMALAFWNTGEGGEIPLLVVAGMWLLADRAERSAAGDTATRERAKRPSYDTGQLIAIASVILAGSWIAFQDGASIAMTATGRAYRTSVAPTSQRFDAAPLNDYVIPADANWVTEIWRSEDLPMRINAGLTLIRSHSTTNDSVLTLGFSNVFPYALGTRPPRGVPVFLDLDNNLSTLHHPPPDGMFADVDIVAIPIVRPQAAPQGGAERVGALLRIYQPYLNAHYVEVARSEDWILLRRDEAGARQ